MQSSKDTLFTQQMYKTHQTLPVYMAVHIYIIYILCKYVIVHMYVYAPVAQLVIDCEEGQHICAVKIS